MQTMRWIAVSIMVLLLLLACTHQHTDVEWPELRTFDHVAEELESQIDQDLSLDELTDQVDRLSAAGHALLKSPIPKNIASEQLVRHRLDELAALLNDLDQTEVLTTEYITPFHALAEALMEAAGMPHTHDH